MHFIDATRGKSNVNEVERTVTLRGGNSEAAEGERGNDGVIIDMINDTDTEKLEMRVLTGSENYQIRNKIIIFEEKEK